MDKYRAHCSHGRAMRSLSAKETGEILTNFSFQKKKSPESNPIRFITHQERLALLLSSITVQSRTLSPSPSPGIAPVVLLDPVATTLTVAELIQQAVARQIAVLQQQQAIKIAEASRATLRHYLAAEDLAAQAKPGTIGFPTPQADHDDQASDEISTAVRRAWRAFEQRAYLIVIDGTIARSLEEEITCPHDRTVTFLRLMPLVGG